MQGAGESHHGTVLDNPAGSQTFLGSSVDKAALPYYDKYISSIYQIDTILLVGGAVLMYELFILGELMDVPMHGYMLHQIAQTAIGPLRQMSWGALYPLIRKLEAAGLIVADETEVLERCGRARKIYRITQSGRQRFHSLMVQRDAYDSDYADGFSIKLSNFHHITRDDQAAILDHYARYIEFMSDYLEACRERVTKQPAIPEKERGSILRVIDHRLCLLQTDQGWTDREIASLRGDRDDIQGRGDRRAIGSGKGEGGPERGN